MTPTRIALVATLLVVFTGCADLKVQLQYAADPRIERISAGIPVPEDQRMWDAEV